MKVERLQQDIYSNGPRIATDSGHIRMPNRLARLSRRSAWSADGALAGISLGLIPCLTAVISLRQIPHDALCATEISGTAIRRAD